MQALAKDFKRGVWVYNSVNHCKSLDTTHELSMTFSYIGSYLISQVKIKEFQSSDLIVVIDRRQLGGSLSCCGSLLCWKFCNQSKSTNSRHCSVVILSSSQSLSKCLDQLEEGDRQTSTHNNQLFWGTWSRLPLLLCRTNLVPELSWFRRTNLVPPN